MSQYRAIESGGGGEWDSKLLKDLSFIKKKLRYPYGKVIAISLIAFLVMALVAAIKLLTMPGVNYPAVFVVMGGIAALMLTPALQYVVALKFKAIETRYSAAGNTDLLDAFFEAQNLLVYRHPDVEGVFQLQSKPVVFRQASTREIIMFIADDRRILINTHYSDFNFGHSAAAREMQRRLRDWLNGGYAKNDHSITGS